MFRSHHGGLTLVGDTDSGDVLRGEVTASGRADKAREVLTTLERLAHERYVPPCAIALVYAGLNDDERVFEWLESALAVRDVHLIYLLVDPKWDRFREDVRFRDVLRRCGLIRGERPQQP